MAYTSSRPKTVTDLFHGTTWIFENIGIFRVPNEHVKGAVSYG
jgi:hypothetical protein